MQLPAASIERDLKKILWIQAIRAYLYGFAAVVLGKSLVASGMSITRAGLVGTAMLLGMGLSALLVGTIGDRAGRRRLYAALLVGIGFVGTIFALITSFWILFFVALTGTISTDANDNGPVTTLEQSMIAEASPVSRIRVFGRYNAVAYLAGAAGALTVRALAWIRSAVPGTPIDQHWLLMFPVGAVVGALLASSLSDEMEKGAATGSGRSLERSRRTVFQLAGLFSVDSFAGGFVVTFIIVLWFGVRFGASAGYMGGVIFIAGLLQAASSILAARLAGTLGLLNTMVFSHLPSNILLLLVPLMPNLPLATAVLLARFALSQMDVPTRQAYIAAMVDPKERTAAAGITNTARYLSRPFGPAIGTALMQNVATGAPFVVAGAVKSVYDLILWRVFKRVPLPEGERS